MECYVCGRDIPNGELCMTVSYQLERMCNGAIDAEDGESLLTACIDCAPPKARIRSALLAALSGGTLP